MEDGASSSDPHYMMNVAGPSPVEEESGAEEVNAGVVCHDVGVLRGGAMRTRLSADTS